MSDIKTRLSEVASGVREKHQSVFARLRHEVNFGVAQSIPSARLTQCAVDSGFQFIIFDCEHDGFTKSELDASVRILRGTNTLGIVRLSVKDLPSVPRYLYQSAHGILLAHVRTALEVKSLVEQATGGDCMPSPLLLALIETAQAIDNIDAIAGTHGVHGLLIGPRDLGKALEVGEDFKASRYCLAFERVERAAREAGLLLGTRPHPEFLLPRLRAGGHTLILLGSDRLVLSSGYEDRLKIARGEWRSSSDARPPTHTR